MLRLAVEGNECQKVGKGFRDHSVDGGEDHGSSATGSDRNGLIPENMMLITTTADYAKKSQTGRTNLKNCSVWDISRNETESYSP